MLNINVNPNSDDDHMHGKISMSGTMTDVLEECLFTVQYIFESLLEEDIAAAFTFMRGCKDGLPFIVPLTGKKSLDDCDNCECDGCDCNSESDCDTHLEDLKPIFKGIMFTNGKGDSKSETD